MEMRCMMNMNHDDKLLLFCLAQPASSLHRSRSIHHAIPVSRYPRPQQIRSTQHPGSMSLPLHDNTRTRAPTRACDCVLPPPVPPAPPEDTSRSLATSFGHMRLGRLPSPLSLWSRCPSSLLQSTLPCSLTAAVIMGRELCSTVPAPMPKLYYRPLSDAQALQ